MWGHKQSEPDSPSSTRYKVESFYSAGKLETFTAGLEKALNSGEDRGWKVAFLTQHAGTFFIFWDTQSQ